MWSNSNLVCGLVSCIAVFGVAPTDAAAQGTLTASFDTSEAGGSYAPENIVAAWIEDANGTFVRTVGRWANRRIDHLVAWSAASGQDADAVSGATRSNHNARLTVTWDLANAAGAAVANGSYVLRIETCDRNSSLADQNNQGSFGFTVDGQPGTQTVAGDGYSNVSLEISYAAPGDCGNGVVDTGESCDPMATCPSTCQANADACIATVLQGTADTCTAECVDTPITTCVDGDGCCASECTAATDDDCIELDAGPSNGGVNAGPLTGSCAAGGHGGAPGLIFFIVGAIAFTTRRRRAGRD